MTFLKLHNVYASQKFYFDSHDNVRAPFAMHELHYWSKFTDAKKIRLINVQENQCDDTQFCWNTEVKWR